MKTLIFLLGGLATASAFGQDLNKVDAMWRIGPSTNGFHAAMHVITNDFGNVVDITIAIAVDVKKVKAFWFPKKPMPRLHVEAPDGKKFVLFAGPTKAEFIKKYSPIDPLRVHRLCWITHVYDVDAPFTLKNFTVTDRRLQKPGVYRFVASACVIRTNSAGKFEVVETLPLTNSVELHPKPQRK